MSEHQQFQNEFQDKLTHLEVKMNHFQKILKNHTITQQRPLLSGDYGMKTDHHLRDFITKGIIGDGVEVKALTSDKGTTGGYLLPQPLVEMVEKRVEALSPLRRIARVSQVSTDGLELLLDKTPGEVGWVSDKLDALETTTPELRKKKIEVHQLFARPRVSQKLLDDASIQVEEWLSERIAEQMARIEGQAFITGDGVGKPKGLLAIERQELGKSDPEKIETLFVKKLEADHLIDLFTSQGSEFIQESCWLMSRSALANIRKLKDSNGQYLWQHGHTEGLSSSLLGHPVVLCDDMPLVSETKEGVVLAFGNFKQGYQIVDRSGLDLLRDPYSAKPFIEFYATKRVGGDVINPSSLRLLEIKN